MVLWKSFEVIEATGGQGSGHPWEASRVCIDSRVVQPGDLFVALKGERFDGHAYVAQAFERGAVAALVEPRTGNRESNVVEVGDTFAALQHLGRYARARSRARVTGITGSVGKTSAKEALAVALSSQGSVHATGGNYNNHIGVPLTLANLPEDCDFAVIEMGMNHPGEITPLARMARPHAALITAIEAAHMEFFDSVEAIAAAKCEICTGIEPGGSLLLPADSPHCARMYEWAKECGVAHVLTFGSSESSDFRLISCRAEGLGMQVEAEISGTSIRYRIGAYGHHFAALSVAVLGMAEALGADLPAAAEALARFVEPEGRGKICRIPLEEGAFVLIDDSYNASPASMRAAFAKLAGLRAELGATGRTVAVLGDMLELGVASPELHAGLAADLVARGIDQVLLAGKEMRYLCDALPGSMCEACRDTAAELLADVQQSIRAGDVVLVKGSHGSKMYELARALKEERM